MFGYMRRLIAALIVAGLAIGVFLLWPRAEPDDPPDTLATPSTTSSTSDLTTTTDAGTTTSIDGTQVVETVEEAEAILREHYYKWFLGIYRQDRSLIESTVILDSQVEAAANQFGVMDFSEEPTTESFQISETEILESTEECLVVFASITASFRPGSTEGVVVFRDVDSDWKLLSSWQSPDDLWEQDCSSTL
jgi:hypothetical protein